MVEALLGVAVGVLSIFVARAIRGQHWMYSIGLVVLPGLYALFAVRAGEPGVLTKEVVYGIPFWAAGLAFAFVGVRYSAVVVGALWILHGLYDVAHSGLFRNSGVPAWYPVWCCSVDLVVGGYLLWLSPRLPGANLRPT